MFHRAGLLVNCHDNDQAGGMTGAWYHDWFPDCHRLQPTCKDPGEMCAAGEDVYLWLIDCMIAVLEARDTWTGKLMFYRGCMSWRSRWRRRD